MPESTGKALLGAKLDAAYKAYVMAEVESMILPEKFPAMAMALSKASDPSPADKWNIIASGLPSATTPAPVAAAATNTAPAEKQTVAAESEKPAPPRKK